MLQFVMERLLDAIFLGGLGLVMTIEGLAIRRQAELLLKLPTSRLDSAATGYVKIEGTAELEPDSQPLQSPLTRTPCCWGHYSIVISGWNTKGTGLVCQARFRVIAD